MASYPVSQKVPTARGTVTQSETRIVSVNITADSITDDSEAEYVITLNGRFVRRMTHFQARRFGLFQ